jgi:hypothetical protein
MAIKCPACGETSARHQVARSEYDPVAPQHALLHAAPAGGGGHPGPRGGGGGPAGVLAHLRAPRARRLLRGVAAQGGGLRRRAAPHRQLHHRLRPGGRQPVRHAGRPRGQHGLRHRPLPGQAAQLAVPLPPRHRYPQDGDGTRARAPEDGAGDRGRAARGAQAHSGHAGDRSHAGGDGGGPGVHPAHALAPGAQHPDPGVHRGEPGARHPRPGGGRPGGGGHEAHGAGGGLPLQPAPRGSGRPCAFPPRHERAALESVRIMGPARGGGTCWNRAAAPR